MEWMSILLYCRCTLSREDLHAKSLTVLIIKTCNIYWLLLGCYALLHFKHKATLCNLFHKICASTTYYVKLILSIIYQKRYENYVVLNLIKTSFISHNTNQKEKLLVTHSRRTLEVMFPFLSYNEDFQVARYWNGRNL